MPGFRHQAIFYEGEGGYLDQVRPVIEDAVGAGCPILVAVPSEKAKLLRDAMDGISGARFLPMEEVGRNPGRILSLWYDFLDEASGSDSARGVGEPVWAGRSAEELVECQLHEKLLNHAFQGLEADFRLFCPYDLAHLDEPTLREAQASHPTIADQAGPRASPIFDPSIDESQLPRLEVHSDAFVSTTGRTLADLRAHLAGKAAGFGLKPRKLSDFRLAVNEVLTNSIEYAGGGRMAVWKDDDSVVCQVDDSGHITDPLVGRRRPPPTAPRGRGLWLANQLCDLVQLRSGRSGTQVRLHATIAG
jgi:anti-sigma regulatory factor (Ser/Thr protein kinase)